MTKQNLFTEEELAKVTDEAERKHLIECAQDQSKIDARRIFEAIAMILSNRNDGIRVQLSEIKTKAAKAS